MLIAIIILSIFLAATLFFFIRSKEAATHADAQCKALQENIKHEAEAHAQQLQQNEQRHLQEITRMQDQFQIERVNTQNASEQQKAELQRMHKEELEQLETRWKEQMAALRTEFANLTHENLKLQADEMKTTNKESMDNLLSPLRLTIETFKKDFSDSMKQQGETDAVMKAAIQGLNLQTEVLGKNAEHLTQALKADPKKQGNWGEVILQNILEASGMTQDVDFFTQESTKDDEGRRYIPDVKVKLHGNSYIIIDSKTSIKAYLDYINASDAQQQEAAIKEHLASVRQHVTELADKHYQDKVQGAAEYVLMFIPNEGSYILAMENDPKLATDAYNRHVIIVNPTNLMLALKIVWLFWQTQKQEKNVLTIIESAKKLYDKFATFTDTFADIEKKLSSLTAAMEQGRKQLSEGRGNIARQIEDFKKKGVITEKKINSSLLLEENSKDDETAEEEEDQS